jgi:hypothetical protein
MSRTFPWIVTFLLAAPLAAQAHHSYTEFDDQQTIEIEGTLTTARWQNPHALLIVTTADGRSVEVETSPVNYFRRLEVPLDLYQVGSTVRVAGWPSKRSVVRMYGTNILSSAGQELVLWRAPPRWRSDAFGLARPSAVPAADFDETLFQVWGSAYAVPGQPDDPDASPAALRRVPLPLTEAGRRWLETFPLDDTPALGCKPKGMWAIMANPTPLEFVDEGESIVLRLEEFDSVRTIHMDDGGAADSQPRTPLGYSVGRWENDTLVVETTRLGGGWIPLGPSAKLVERFSIGDNGRLLYSILISDPELLTQPVEQKRSWLPRPNEKVLPFDCQEARGEPQRSTR